jgi:hypothetical protein
MVLPLGARSPGSRWLHRLNSRESRMENGPSAEAPDPLVSSIRDLIARKGASELVVDELKPEDLQSIGWSGTPTHIRSVRDDARPSRVWRSRISGCEGTGR